MTETEKTSLIEEIKSYRKWMEDSSGYEETKIDISEQAEYDIDYDICEIFVTLHLINGEQIALRNHCYESFTTKRYFGDKIEYWDTLPHDVVEVYYHDEDDKYHQCRVPVSSICYINAYAVPLNWSNLYEYVWKKENGR